MVRPRALRPGSRIAIVSPASPFDRAEFDAGLGELRALGYEPVHDERVFAREPMVSGPARLRAEAFLDALRDPSIDAILAVRGGYGSVEILPYLDARELRDARKIICGYSDITSLLVYAVCHAGLVAFHGPMIDRRLSRGEAGYHRASFAAAFVVACALLGLFLAELRVSRLHRDRDHQLAESYLRLIDPLLLAASNPPPPAPANHPGS